MEVTARPLHDRVLVRRLEEEETSKDGIIVPDSAKEKPQMGIVIAVGKGRPGDDGKIVPLEVRRGDHVIFGKYAGSEIKVQGHELLIMSEGEIFCIL